MNNSMTGTIFLSSDDSAAIRQNILNPSKEYIRERSAFFEKLASSMIIHTTGTDSVVEFNDLDLSALDALLEEEANENVGEIAVKPVSYISTSANVTFVNVNRSISPLRSALFIDATANVAKENYTCNKQSANTEIQGCNLTEAA